MKTNFLQSYLDAFPTIQGFFTFDAALMFMAYNQLSGAKGDVLEIGVHHGLSAIAIGSLVQPGRRFVAVDLFEMQDSNRSRSGAGNREVFLNNMQRFFDDLDFLQVIAGSSSALRPERLGSQFSFCHIDGGHSPEETYQDLDLCSKILLPGGLLALDDYFNPAFPGVSEGAVKFKLDHAETLKPIAIGFNKVLFQKLPARIDLNAAFASTFKRIPSHTSVLWDTRVNYFTSSFTPFFDLQNSLEHRLVLKAQPDVAASFEPQTTRIESEPGQALTLAVTVQNRSDAPFPHGKTTFGLSYHLLSSTGEILKFDNPRSYFEAPLQPDSSVTVDLIINAPVERGSYLIEIDLVWEGMMWFKESGNPTCTVALIVGPALGGRPII
jgi:predicted O-methyltransferase YrrM